MMSSMGWRNSGRKCFSLVVDLLFQLLRSFLTAALGKLRQMSEVPRLDVKISRSPPRLLPVGESRPSSSTCSRLL